jgi:DNA-binding NtrC family response regulator
MTSSVARDSALTADAPLPGMVGTHPLMRDVYRLVRQAAPKDLPVAIVGETGVGKELVARALHELSPRGHGPFIAVNAAAVPDMLFESELFGHERGAFSDARTAKPGLLEVAHRGTFFCDEIAMLSPACQAKLLRVVEEGVIRRVGGVEARGAAPRWIMACQEYDAVKPTAKGLRDDLWYRLSAVIVAVPALRERRSDIPALVTHFLAASGFDPGRLERDAVDRLVAGPWPGNVRQLRRVLERLALRANGSRISGAAVRFELERPSDPSWERERAELLETLEAQRWNLRRVARTLGIARGTLYRRMRAAGLERPPKVCRVFLERSLNTLNT